MDISVIIPTINRGHGIHKTIQCLLDQQFDPDRFEILVVDGGSSDNSQEIVREIIANHTAYQIKLIVEPEPGVMPARHRGVQDARGAIIVFIEDDARAIPTHLQSVYDAFQLPGVGLVGGPCLPDYESSPPAWLQYFWTGLDHGRALGYLSLIDLGSDICDTDPLNIWALNFSIKQETFYELKGFNPDLLPRKLMRYQGDGESGLSYKIKAAGLRAIYHPGAAIYHETLNSRFDPEHFSNRAYFQGVCDSYTSIRKHGAVDARSGARHASAVPRTGRKSMRYYFSHPIHFMRDVWHAARHRLRYAFYPPYRQFLKIQADALQSHKQGYAFHQNEVLHDPALLQWVLKEDYLDYRLPEGMDGNITYADRPYA